MARSIWNMKFLQGIDVQAVRTRVQNDEYNIPRQEKFEFVVKDADIQPVKGNDIQIIPEGYRGKSLYKVYSKTPMTAGKEGTDNLPDKLLIFGEWHSVFVVEKWLHGLDDYYLAYLVNENLR